MKRLVLIWMLVFILMSCGLFIPKTFATDNPAGNKTAPPRNNRLAGNVVIDSMVLHKAAHELLVYSKGVLVKRYRVQLGSNPVGPKRFEGDGRTPEGLYYINAKNPDSRFHKSLGISYPNQNDLQRAAKLGRSPGGNIVIHGLPNGEENAPYYRYRNDWTSGCIAVRNSEIDELFDHVEVGTPLLITP